MNSSAMSSIPNSAQMENIVGLEVSEHSTVPETLAGIHSLVKKNGHPPLLSRQVIPVGGDGVSGNGKFRVMQFNILAQGLSMGDDNFSRCPQEALVWNTRKIRIVEEILTVDPDVLCMQEVDHFGFFTTLLGPLGYEGCFKPKPDSPALYSFDSNGPDGCALFYKTGTFEKVKHEGIVLKDGEYSTNQVSIIYTLKMKDTGKVVTIATTHLKAKTGYESLRHSQGKYLLDYITQNYGENPVVVCGDFNAEPCEPIYQEFANSTLGLVSAYTAVSANGKEPAYTTWKIRGTEGNEREYCRTIDYIWYRKNRVPVTGIRSIPSEEDVGPDRLPSFTYPSDHLSLAADFVII